MALRAIAEGDGCKNAFLLQSCKARMLCTFCFATFYKAKCIVILLKINCVAFLWYFTEALALQKYICKIWRAEHFPLRTFCYTKCYKYIFAPGKCTLNIWLCKMYAKRHFCSSNVTNPFSFKNLSFLKENKIY